MELRPSQEAANCAATQELPRILWNPKVCYHVHKKSPPTGSLSRARSIRFIPPYPISLRSILIATHWGLGLPSGLFPSGFPTNILHVFCSSPHSCYMPSSPLPRWIDHSNYVWQRVQVMKLLIMQFLPISQHFISRQTKYSLQHPVLKHPQSVFFP
jgi:hypothetical protein